MFTIKYGVKTQNIDITQISYETLMKNNIIRIPRSDTSRAMIFTDSVPGIKKDIIISYNEEEKSCRYQPRTYFPFNRKNYSY